MPFATGRRGLSATFTAQLGFCFSKGVIAKA